MSKFNLVDEKLRLEIKSKADETRYKWSKRGYNDIFSILENASILVRRPLSTKKISGFSTFFENKFIVFLNSSFTLGHEIYSGAHELFHITYNSDVLKREYLLLNDDINEEYANIFAAEFLMPEEGVKEVFFKQVDVSSDKVEAKHIVRMHNYFKVSYKAMLKQLVNLKLCDIKRYDYLINFSSVEKAEELKKITIQEGYSTNLIEYSNIKFFSKEYVEIVKRNYENNKISFKKLEEFLSFIGKSPEDYGYEKDEEY